MSRNVGHLIQKILWLNSRSLSIHLPADPSSHHIDNPLYEAITRGKKFSGYKQLLPLFYDSCSGLVDYLNNPVIIFDNLSKQAILEFEHSYNDFYKARLDANKLKFNSFYPTLSPSQLYLTALDNIEILEQKDNILIGYENSEQASVIENIAAASFLEKKTVFKSCSKLSKLMLVRKLL